MERNWKSPLLSLTFNFQPNANSIPQLLLRKPRNDYLSSARYYDSSNSRPNVIRIYIYIYPCKLLVSYLTDDWRAKKRGSSRLQTYRTIEPRVEVFAANQPRLPPPPSSSRERKQYFPVASLLVETVPWNFFERRRVTSEEKGKDKKKRRIICRRDSANQFPIKFPRTRPKDAS